MNGEDDAPDSNNEHGHASPVDYSETTNIAKPSRLAKFGRATLNEFVAQKEKYHNHGEDCDTDWENEKISPARVCKITTDDGTNSVTDSKVSITASEHNGLHEIRFGAYLVPLTKERIELFLAFSASVAPSERMMRLKLMIPAAPRP